METKRTIFDSRSEEQLFRAISGEWEPAYRLYPHIPFANLVELNPQHLSTAEISYLHKSTVDYVLTDSEHRPLLGIEFDGLTHGVSRDGIFMPQRAFKADPARSWKLATKCRVAHEASLPFAVISYDEAAVVDADVGLTIAHGMVGAFVANYTLRGRIPELAAEIQERLPDLSPEEFHDEMQDSILAAELDADVEHNPIVRREIALSTELKEIEPTASVSWRLLVDPEAPEGLDPWSEGFDAAVYLRWKSSIQRLGVETTISGESGTESWTTWVRNVSAGALGPMGWMMELGSVVAISSYLAKRRTQ